MSVIDRLNILRYKQGLEMKEIAKQLDVSRDTIRNWVNGVVPKDPFVLRKINDMFNFNSKDSLSCKKVLDVLWKVDDREWDKFVLGLIYKLNLSQTSLSILLGFKTYNPIISGWTRGTSNPNRHMKFKLVELAKIHRLNLQELITCGRFVQNSISFPTGGRLANTNASPKEGINEDLVFNKNRNFFINSCMLFPNDINGKSVKIIKLANKIIVFYKNDSRSQPTPLIMPRQIAVDETFLVGLGIYLAEGSRDRSPKVTNSEPSVINQSIKFFNTLRIHKFKAWIQLHERSSKSFIQAKKFWMCNIHPNDVQITKVRLKKSEGSAKVKEYGVLHLEVYSVLLKHLINNLIQKTPYLVEELPNYLTVHFLQGEFAGEGSVDIYKKSLRSVKFTSTNFNERRLVKRLLERLGIAVHEDEKRFDLRIHGFDNLNRLIQLDIFKFHKSRKEKLELGFKHLSQSHIPGLNKNRIVDLLKTVGIFETSEIAEVLELSCSNVRKHLSELHLLDRVKKVKHNNRFKNKWFAG
jgi:predicted transcriptional regulator